MGEALALAGAAQLRRVVGRGRCLAAASAELEASGPRCSMEELPAKHDRADVVAGPHLAEELGIPPLWLQAEIDTCTVISPREWRSHDFGQTVSPHGG